MAEQIYIGNFAKGLKLDRLPFNIDNDAFPRMENFYSWRGRAKRKRGTSLLGQLQRQIQSVAIPANPWEFSALILIAGAANLITGPWTQGASAISVTLESTGAIVPGSISVVVGANTYTDPLKDGILVGTPAGSGTINYATGAITIVAGGAGPLTGTFSYYPQLPVLGLEDFVSNISASQFPLLIAFDTTYSYQVNQAGIPFFYSTSYYKGTNNPVVWSNFDYAQFWSTNYQNAFWVTNNKSGFHYKALDGIASSQAATPTNVNFRLLNHGLIIGDYIFVNEVTGALGSSTTANQNINTMTGRVSSVGGVNSFNADFTGNNGTTAANFVPATTGDNGIVQYLTSNISGQDGIRWYDGDPTGGTGIPTVSGLGWVNFSPPLTATTVSIDDQTAATYYLVGALMIVPFKDRLLFLGPHIQAVGGPVIQQSIEDMVIWSWNGTPYYTALVPTAATISETYDPRSYYVDQTGFGGYLPAGISKPIMTCMDNEDVLLIGFGGTGKKTRFVYTGNDLQPFLFYLINSELPSSSTFSGIVLDKGGVDIGQYGITITTQQSCERIDLDIPDEVFEIQALNNGQNRVNAGRDFFREWMYFSYPIGNGVESQASWKFPLRTLMWNYRDDTWSLQKENFTHHGIFRKSTYFTWDTLPYKTWDDWNQSWDSGNDVAQYPSVIAGNPQGYVLVKDDGTNEAVSGSILNILDDGLGNTQINSINHCVSLDDYLSFMGETIGKVVTIVDVDNFVVDISFPSTANVTAVTQSTSAVVTLEWPIPVSLPYFNSYFVGQRVSFSGVVGMTQLNGNTYTIIAVTPTTITIAVDSTGFTTYISGGTTTLVDYIGTGKYVRLSQPIIQTKQFPVYWQEGRQVRVGVQKYLMDRTNDSQVTVVIALSQDPDNAYNEGPIVPDINAPNNGLTYSQTLFTCPESTNLGLTAANTNLQMPIADKQFQIWHRINTSLIGNTFQLGISLSDAQMRNITYATSEIALHGLQITVDRGPDLC